MRGPSLLNFRPAAVAGLLLVGTSIGLALALQHILGWAPCPLCIVQRLTAMLLVVGLALLALPAAGQGTSKLLTLTGLFLILLGCVGGLAAGGVHLYILYGEEKVSCGPGLELAINNLVSQLPAADWFLAGAGLCSEADYAIVGVPLPALSMAVHAAAAALAIVGTGIVGSGFGGALKTKA